MSIIAYYKQVSPSTLNFILKNPDLLTDFIFDNDKTPKLPRLHAVMNPNDEIPSTDTDKAWQGLLFLLNNFGDGSKPEPYDAILGIGEVSPVEVSVGPAHYLTAPEVAKLALSLAKISRAELFAAYDPEAMAEEVDYPLPMSEEDSETDQEYIWLHFQEMTRYFNDAAGRGNAIITYLL